MEKDYIIVKNLTKEYKDLLALNDVSFGIKKGETLGLLGPNGAGKSTFVSIFTGVVKPTSGEVIIDGEIFSSKTSHLKKLIGYVPQDIALYPTLSGLDNLKFWAEIYGHVGADKKERIEEVISIIRLGDRINDRVDTYSGGMKRRLNIGVALLHRPEILIMDEPTVGIDLQSKKYIFETIQELKDKNKTIILVTHQMDEMKFLCDKIAVLEAGKLKAIGSKSEMEVEKCLEMFLL